MMGIFASSHPGQTSPPKNFRKRVASASLALSRSLRRSVTLDSLGSVKLLKKVALNARRQLAVTPKKPIKINLRIRCILANLRFRWRFL
jgi:hypothetical protein